MSICSCLLLPESSSSAVLLSLLCSASLLPTPSIPKCQGLSCLPYYSPVTHSGVFNLLLCLSRVMWAQNSKTQRTQPPAHCLCVDALPAVQGCPAPLWHFWEWLGRTGVASGVCFLGPVQRGFHLSVCVSLAGRPRALVLVKEQSRHFRQSGEGGRSDPVSGSLVFWACMEFFCWVYSMFAAHGGAGELKRGGVAWSGDEEGEEALNSSSQLIQGQQQS